MRGVPAAGALRELPPYLIPFRPRRSALADPRSTPGSPPSGAGLTLARWELQPRDGSPAVRGDLRAPPGPPPASVVVLCHGFKGFKDWGFFPALARAIAHRGHAVLSFNFSRSGIGADGVDFSALDRFAENTHSRNVDEIRMVLDAVITGRLFPRPPRQIGLFGHSRGGGEAVLAAAEDSRVNALVTWAAIASVERWTPAQRATWERGETVYIANSRTGQQMPMGPGYWHDLVEQRERLDIRRAAAAVRVPWLIVHGAEDESVQADDARVLHAAASENSELKMIEGAGHTLGAVHPYAGTTSQLREATTATADWFDRYLRPAGSAGPYR